MTMSKDDEAQVIVGKTGEMYAFDSTRLAVMLQLGSAAAWTARRKQCEAAGFTTFNAGHTEGVLLFDPTNETQAAAALRVAGVKQRRTASSAQRAALAVARSKRR
jgi:hypothetical protein